MVELPKLLRISLRTTPLDERILEMLPLTELEPSEGYGPLVSVGSAMQALVLELEELLELLEELLELELELELLDELLLEPPLLPPPHAVTRAAAPPVTIQPSS